jgi:hypothetical protein
MNEIYIRIGLICSNFEYLDLLLSAIIGRIISEDSKIGAIMTSEMSFRNLINVFSSLILYKFESDKVFKEKIENLLKLLNNAEEKRNQIIHSTYAYDESDKITQIKITARQKIGLKIHSDEISVSDLEEINQNIRNLIQEIRILYRNLFNEEIKIA